MVNVRVSYLQGVYCASEGQRKDSRICLRVVTSQDLTTEIHASRSIKRADGVRILADSFLLVCRVRTVLGMAPMV